MKKVKSGRWNVSVRWTDLDGAGLEQPGFKEGTVAALLERLGDVGSRIEMPIRRLIYRNLGGFRMDMIDAMARSPGSPLDGQAALRERWLTTSALEQAALMAAVTWEMTARDLRAMLKLVWFLARYAPDVVEILSREIANCPDRLVVNGHRWVRPDPWERAPLPEPWSDPNAGT